MSFTTLQAQYVNLSYLGAGDVFLKPSHMWSEGDLDDRIRLPCINKAWVTYESD